VPQRSYAHAAALGAIATVCLAGCSAGADVDPERFEVAIRSHAVATSRRTAPWPTWTVAGSRPRVANERSCRGRRPLVWGDPLCRLL